MDVVDAQAITGTGFCGYREEEKVKERVKYRLRKNIVVVPEKA